MCKPNNFWSIPSPELTLHTEEVHVWRVPLVPDPAAPLAWLSSLLSPDERQRAARFRFAHDQERFVIARSTLRLLLGRYLGLDCYRGSFDQNEYGRPSLPDSAFPFLLDFNLSHSGALALYALARQRRVGVDVEAIRELSDLEQIAARFFSSREQATLLALPPEQRHAAFFYAWTRKEAYIKARGEGLSLALDAFDVSLTPGEPAALLETRDDPEQARQWRLAHLEPGEGYTGALVVSGEGWHLSAWQWQAFP